jgi:hypothetical protein
MRRSVAVGHRRDMAQTYLVECYWADVAEPGLREHAARVRSTVEEEQGVGGPPVELLRAVVIPGDEVSLWIFTGGSLEDVERVSGRCGLTVNRVVECIELTAEPGSAHPPGP